MNNYNNIAFCYHILVKIVFGNALLKAQKNYLSSLPDKGTLLIIGGGRGELLNPILKQKPLLKIDYVDQSKKMVEVAQKKRGITAINFIIGDESSIPRKNYDAIISFFFLDLFEENNQKLIIELLKNKLKANGIWLVADFNKPTSWWQHLIEKTMFLFLKKTTKIESSQIDNYRSRLSRHGLLELENATFYHRFVFSAVYILNPNPRLSSKEKRYISPDL